MTPRVPGRDRPFGDTGGAGPYSSRDSGRTAVRVRPEFEELLRAALRGDEAAFERVNAAIHERENGWYGYWIFLDAVFGIAVGTYFDLHGTDEEIAAFVAAVVAAFPDAEPAIDIGLAIDLVRETVQDWSLDYFDPSNRSMVESAENIALLMIRYTLAEHRATDNDRDETFRYATELTEQRLAELAEEAGA
jgi:hypothetical protein